MRFSQAVRSGVFGLTALVSLALLSGCGGGGPSTAVPAPITAPIVLAPACGSPAPLLGDYQGLATYFVTLTPGTSAAEQAPLLAAKYGFTVEYTFTSSPTIFSAILSPEVLARLRCDPLVIETGYVGTGGGASQ
jgi:hypothetical protein